MNKQDLDQKILDTFKEFAIDKGLITRLGLSRDDRHIPSYVMDWIVTFAQSKVGTNTGRLRETVVDFIKKHLPSKGEKESIKFRLSQGETLTILDALSVEVKLGKTPEYFTTIPCLDEKKAKIEAELLRQHEGLLQSSIWGAAKIRHDDDGGVRVIEFKPMQIGRISLDAYRDCREAFTVSEWIDLLIRTMGYEPTEYSESEKLWLLCRLIPIVHNRVNMMELAPPGSGKSFVYNNISRHVWLTAAQISAPVLFYNRQSHTPGLLTRYDLLVLDEAQSLQFNNPGEIQAQLKGYLEQGVYTRGDCAATAECGLMLLANIDIKSSEARYKNNKPAFVPSKKDYIRRLPDLLLESPLVDRFHGIIPGWKIPPFETTQQAQGYGLKADYFAEVCHALRSASDIAQNVRARLRLSGGKRDCTAIERIACGMAKLLLIGPDDERFEELVVRPAEEMRRNVRSQLHELDPYGYTPELLSTRLGSGSATKTNVVERLAHYDLLEEVGRGGFAKVFKGIDTRTGTVVAVKMATTDGNSNDERTIRREIDIYERLKQIPNPHLLVVREIFREGDRYALITEYADGGTLWDLTEADAPGQLRKAMDDATVKEISLSILDGLCALHENKIVHRDIKPQNILRCDDTWKIADFGISKLCSSPVTGFTMQGAHSMPWAPPEQRDGAAAHPSADIFAMGRVMAFLLTGSVETKDYTSLHKKWWSIIQPCLSINPDERPCAQVLREQVAQMPDA